MKAIVDPHNFKKELGKVAPAINHSTVLPILESVKLEFGKGELVMTATDLRTTIVTRMDCECTKPFTVVVDFKMLNDSFKILSSPVLIEEKKNSIELKADDYKSKLPTAGPVDTFPSMPDDNFSFRFNADADFFQALKFADQCKWVDEDRTNLNSACIHFKEDHLVIVGTDAFVLYTKKLEINTGKNHKSLIRDNHFIEAVKDLKSAEVFIGEKFVKVTDINSTIITTLQNATYADYHVLFPNNIEYNFEANRTDFITALSRASVTANKATKMCALNFKGNSISITSQDLDFQMEGEVNFKANHSVGIDAIGVNASQLTKILSMLDGEEIKMSISSPTRSMFIKNSKSDEVLCLLQPLMLNN